MPYQPPNVPDALHNVLMQALVDQLEAKMLTDATDDAKAGLVRAGKLQDDPTDTKITILVHPGGRDFPHTLNRDNEGPAMFAPVYEIGGGFADGRTFQGGVFNRKRFTVELTLFYPNENYRLRAQIISGVVLSRAVHAIYTMTIPNMPDAFGEAASGQVQILDHYIEESGGEGTFIWRGKIQVEFMTNLIPA